MNTNITENSYERVISQLNREDFFIYHPRTCERIVSCTSEPIPKISKEHLNRFPRVAYHQKLNSSCGRKFNSHDDMLAWIAGSTDAGNSLFIGKATHQYKTVWITKSGRRR
jgi:hypothetical protein